MGLLHELTEMAAGGTTGAGCVAATPGSLFSGGVLSSKKGRKKQKKGIMLRRMTTSLSMPRLAEALGITTDETKFNPADVISKLDAAEKKAKNTEDTVTFGMEDEDGNVVKVYVRAEQAKDFEHALGALLDGEDENSDEQNSALEIAEVLFELRNKFDIIDVDWGQIPTDEEEEQQVMDDQQNPEDMEGMEGDMPPEEMAPDPGADASSALQQVIDLLKAQADAQKAEAEAKMAEAKAKEAEYTAIAAKAKVKQEEEVLDMEAYYKKKADEKKEAKQIAKLAKYKHDIASDAEGMLQGNGGVPAEQGMPPGPGGTAEEEELVSPSRLAELIYGQIRGR